MNGNRYILHEVLGQGGMGKVYRATDRLHARPVALKKVLINTENLLFHSRISNQDEATLRETLTREFQTLASMRHPGIISVLDYGFDDEQHPFFTMSLLENPQTLLEAGADLDIFGKIRLLVQMCQALAYLHRRNVVHRDLKPGNVLVSDGSVRVLDFGLAVTGSESSGVAGTPAYIAPELLQGKPATMSADLYAVGVLAWELLTGTYPLPSETLNELLNALLTSLPDIEFLHETLSAHLPPHQAMNLTQVVMRLLSKDPASRYSDAGELVQTLGNMELYTGPLETVALRESFLQGAAFVGRQTELATLRDALQSLNGREKSGSLWLIGGESGAGKSRLLNEVRIAAMVDGIIVIRENAVSEGGQSYQIWQQTMRWLALQEISDTEAAILKARVENIDTLLERPIPDPPEIDPVGVPERLAATLLGIFKRLTHPLLIILEDAHWIEPESLVLLNRLSDELASLPVIMMASYRDDERPDLPDTLPRAQRLRLNRLTSDEIRELSAAILGASITERQSMVDLLERETEGNAFFLVEVVRVLAEEAGSLERVGMLTLPQRVLAGGVQSVLRRRLERLPAAARPLLQLAAVAGRVVDPLLLVHMASGQDVDAWLVEAANAAVLDVVDNRWQFAHDKLREYILAELPESDLPALHQKVAEAIEAVYPDDERYTAALVRHWQMASNPERELHYTLLAGKQAHRISNYQAMYDHFHRVLELLEARNDEKALTIRGEVTLTLGDIYRRQGRYDEAEQLLKNSIALSRQTGNQGQLALSLTYLGTCYSFIASEEKAMENLEEGLTIARQLDDPFLLAEVLTWYGGGLIAGAGDFEKGIEIMEECQALSKKIGSPIHQIRSSYPLAGALSQLHGVEVGIPILKSAVEMAREQGDLYELANCTGTLADLYLQQGKIEEARRLAKETIVMERRINHLEGMIHSLITLIEIAEDETERKTYIIELLRLCIDTDSIAMHLFALGYLASHASMALPPEQRAALFQYIIEHPATWGEIREDVEAQLAEIEAPAREARVPDDFDYHQQFRDWLDMLWGD